MAGGSTLGNISNRHVSLNTVDIGLAQLAMHSPYETAGVQDTEYLLRAMETFFATPILPDGKGGYRLG
jgi:aspartyl aminopeptidase